MESQVALGVQPSGPMTDVDEVPAPGWKSVLHRWFVKYNPLYLVSATLVLYGVTLLMQTTSAEGGVFGQLSSTVVAELYAWALIGSAAILVRRSLWRPAVMLALITALYQCDLTLQTERSVYLGVPGQVATALWIVSFAAKLRALAWAMQLRLSRSAFAVPVLGAAGVAAVPWVLAISSERVGTAVVGLIVFGVVAAGLWTRRVVTSLRVHTGWGRVVQRRSSRAVWIGWMVALLVHVVFLAEHGPSFDPSILVPVGLVLATRALRSERQLWAWLGGTLILVAVFAPAHFAATAVMVATALALWAHRSPTLITRAERRRDPYREMLDEPPRWPAWVLSPTSSATAERLIAGAWTSLYLATWTAAWEGGPWPEHLLWLDTVYLAGVALWMWKTRSGSLLYPAALSLLHFVISEQLVPAPQSKLQWSLVTIGAGFGVLAIALGVSMRTRVRAELIRSRECA